MTLVSKDWEGWGDVVKSYSIQIKYHTNIRKLMTIAKGDWVDLRSAERVVLKPGEFALISLGVSMKLPEGFEAHIVPRSSTFLKWGILQTNGIGIVDNSFSGNDDVWKFPAYATRYAIIEKDDRICQFRIIEIQPNVIFDEVDTLMGESRNGFGSTGAR
jgi:dUTP pyrophosphatase